MNSEIKNSQEQLVKLLDSIDQRLEKLSERMGIAHFNQLTGKEFEDMTVINSAVADVLLDPELSEVISHWNRQNLPGRLSRRVDLVNRRILMAKVENDKDLFEKLQPVQKKIIEFKASIDGQELSRSERGNILESNPDRGKREAAYFAGKELDKAIEDDVLNLMASRNELARKSGYPSYIEMGLESQELTEEQLSSLFESIREETREAWLVELDKIKAQLSVDSVKPWDLVYYQESVLPSPGSDTFPKDQIIEVFKSVLKDAGGDLDQLPIQVVIQDIPYGGLCMPLRLNEDIRILSNPRDGFMSYDTLFHEFGHGIQASGIDNTSHLVTGGDPPFFWEGIAGIYEHLMQSEHVLKNYFNMTDEEIDQIKTKSRFFRMNWFRNIAIACNVEWAAYRGESNLRQIQKQLTKHFLEIDMPDDIGWAGNTLFTTHPLYNQNYVLMDVMALHTIKSMKNQFGAYPSEKLFDFVNEKYIHPGGWVPWHLKIIDATGIPMNTNALSEYLTGS